MKTQSLSDFFLGKFSAQLLEEEIREEVRAYKTAAEVKGSSMPVILTGDQDIRVDTGQVVRLCDSYLSGIMTAWDVQYICAALQMSERTIFRDESIRDALDELDDPESNGELIQDEVRSLKERLLADVGQREND